jgi:Escherichia/Staphylococcus phage prohead protease
MKTKTLERRTIQAPITVREADGASRPILSGYAAKFGKPSQDLGGYVEVLKPGCFAQSIANGDQRAFWNHDYCDLLARTKSGTLRLKEDETGLSFEFDVPDTSLGRDLYELVKRGDVDGVSFGFYALADEWSADGKTNTVTEAELIEISPVVFPAYLDTNVEARSAERLARRPTPRFPRLERARRIMLADDGE